MYRAIDAKNGVKMVSFMTEDSIFRFANMPPVQGKQNIINFLDGFFQSIKSIHHTGIECWNSGNAWFVEGNVAYTRHNDSVLKVPFGVLLKMDADLIKDFLIYVDASELYK